MYFGILVAFLYYNFNFAKAGAEQKFEKGNDVYKHFCGKYVELSVIITHIILLHVLLRYGRRASLHFIRNMDFGMGRRSCLTALAVLRCRWTELMVDAIGAVGR